MLGCFVHLHVSEFLMKWRFVFVFCLFYTALPSPRAPNLSLITKNVMLTSIIYVHTIYYCWESPAENLILSFKNGQGEGENAGSRPLLDRCRRRMLQKGNISHCVSYVSKTPKSQQIAKKLELKPHCSLQEPQLHWQPEKLQGLGRGHHRDRSWHPHRPGKFFSPYVLVLLRLTNLS